MENENQDKKTVKFTPEQMKLAEEYCKHDMAKLKATCYKLFIKQIGGIEKWEYDDLYSLGLNVLYHSIIKYSADKGCKFHTYLCGNLSRRYDTYKRDKNKDKRSNIQEDKDGNKVFLKNESFDLVKQNGQALEECLDSGSKIDDSLEECFNSLYMSENVETYLRKLSRKQRQIVLLLANGYDRKAIMEQLQISAKDYVEHMARIRSDNNVRVLYSKKGKNHEKESY